MDELLHHCVRELSFDGDLGCDAIRLKDFIADFYANNSSYPQNADDSFCAFVWSLVVQQPTVRVGTIPPGLASEVWVAPQISAKRKASAKGEELVEIKPPELNIIPDAHTRSLLDLQQEYGGNLRIAVDPQAIYAAITGSHIRFPKLSPMVYSALQIITRGRENGITVVQLGQQSGYDQKTCFYLVKQLTELDLVVKVRRGGVGTHFCIHRYFFDRSPSWKQIREEESRAQAKAAAPDNADHEEEEMDPKELEEMKSLNFTPIDSRHLSSVPLVRGRVVKLLKASKNQMHASNNLLLIIGFSHPTKTDRRFFNSRMRELIQQGVIERVIVPSNRKHSHPGATTACFRLLNEHGSVDTAIAPMEDEKEEDDKTDDIPDQSGVKMNITIHKQIANLLEEAGTVGMTLSELSTALNQFDRRTVELLLTRADKFPPPSHLSDLGIAGLMETSGRERRHRYFTVSAYRTLVAQENLDQSTAGYGDVDFKHAGGFLPVDPESFYDTKEELQYYEDSFKDKEATRKKTHGGKNPVLPDGTIKQGRPRKQPLDEDGNVIPSYTKRPGKKRKRGTDDPTAEADEACTSKPRGKRRRANPPDEQNDDNVDQLFPSSDPPVPVTPKKRGRPPKDPDAPPKKRGRPPKVKPEGEDDKTPKPKRARKQKAPSKNLTRRKSGRSSRATLHAEQGSSGPPGLHAADIPGPSESQEPEETRSGSLDQVNTPGVAPLSNAEAEAEEHPNGSVPFFVPSQEELNVEELIPPVTALSPIMQGAPSPVEVTPMEVDQTDPEESHPIPIDPALTKGENEAAVNEDSQPLPRGAISQEVDTVAPGAENQPNANDNSGTPAPSSTPVPSAKGKPVQRTDIKPKVNVSHLRRENELFRVVELLGGIANAHSKEFSDTHSRVIDDLAAAGEPTSAPVGTKTDKRTITLTFKAMEDRGRIKQLKTYVPTPTGSSRPVVIAYLPDVGEERLTEFLGDFGRSVQQPPALPPSIKQIDERTDYGSVTLTQRMKAVAPLKALQSEQQEAPAGLGESSTESQCQNSARVEDLGTYDESVIREVLLAERTTVSQMYGFIVAKAIRTREVHLRIMEAFEHRTPSPNIVSYDDRIFSLGFLYLDLPISSYLQLVSTLNHHEDLTLFLSTDSGRKTPVKDLPYNLHTLLQIGRARPRSRLLELMDILRSLNLAIPLKPTTSDTPWLTTNPLGEHPAAYDQATDDWNANTPMLAPMYWKLTTLAPVHHWAVSEPSPPFWKDIPVASLSDVRTFWEVLRAASVSPQLNTDDLSTGAAAKTSATGPISANASIGRFLRRGTSWNASYVLTWHQKQFLGRWIDVSNGQTPLDKGDEGMAQITRVASIISAPVEAVKEYFTINRGKIVNELDKARRRVKNKLQKKVEDTAEGKAKLVKKAAEARAQRETVWDELIQRVHPEALTDAASARVGRVRTRFLQSSGSNLQKWEKQITDAIHESEIASKKILMSSLKKVAANSLNTLIPLASSPPPLASNPPEKSIAELIIQQGPPLESTVRKRSKRSSKGDEHSQPKGPVRRHRFQWNRDYDELARDASVIIRARCRHGIRLDWGAFEQVFPAVARNSVRQRLATIRESAGNEAYLTRLEDRWYELWVQHRGSDALPDDDPTSATNFNLIRHIEFLRNHIDKNAIRVGFVQHQEKAESVLPASLEDLFQNFDIVDPAPATVPTYDFVWNALVEEGREKRLLSQAFMIHSDVNLNSSETNSDSICVAESALKMVLGSPPESYDPELGSNVLRGIGQEAVNTATKNLLESGVLSKLVRDPQKQKPGRQLKISEPNQNSLGGMVSRDLFQDALALEELAEQDSAWRDWPLLATDGDSAALIQLVSDNKVDFTVDTTQAQAARPAIDWNSKKADDDDIETAIRVQFNLDNPVIPDSPPHSIHLMDVAFEEDPNHKHGQTVDGRPACCKRVSSGVVNCSACLEEQWNSLTALFTQEENELARTISETLVQVGGNGIPRSELAETFAVPPEVLFPMLHQMSETPIPLLQWTGYGSVSLVSSCHIDQWTVTLSETPMTQIFPRRWLDISGTLVSDVWEAALRAVVGTILFRPGITQLELRWRLRWVYDRQEVNDVLRFLYEDGLIKSRCDPRMHPAGTLDLGILLTLDGEEEKGVFWFLEENRHWYQV